jgi:phage gp16-like protein
MVAKVHIARKEMGLDEGTYRSVLERVAGQSSSAACTDAQLHSVLAEFKRLGWHPKQTGRPISQKPHVRKVWALWAELRPFLRDGSAGALRSFVKRQTGVADPEWLDGAEAALVTEGLKAWLARGRKNQGVTSVGLTADAEGGDIGAATTRGVQ